MNRGSQSRAGDSNRMRVQNVRAHYARLLDRLGGNYGEHRWHSSALRQEQYLQTAESLSHALAGLRFSIMAEIGCGPLIWTPLFAAVSNKVVAVDLSWEMLRDAGGPAPGVNLCCADVSLLPLRSESVDAVCTVRAFEYFPDQPRAVAEVWRVLRPGGFVLIVTKNLSYAGYGRRGNSIRTIHGGEVTSEQLTRMLSDGGFIDVVIEPVVVGRTRIVAVWRFVRYLRRRIHLRWRRLVPSVVTAFTESLMVTARKT